MKSFFIGLLLLSSLGVLIATVTTQALPNINYFTTGYDIYLGDPLSSSADPGFRQNPIFDLTYPSDLNLIDGQYLTPDNVTARALDNCQVEAYSIQANSSLGLSSSQGTSISGSFGVSFDSFGSGTKDGFTTTASQQYDMSDSDMIAVINGVCESYQVTLQATYPSFDGSFAAAVEQLPENYADGFDYTDDISASSNPYLLFLSEFGTHYITNLTMGSRMTTISFFTEERWDSLQSQGYSDTVGASFSFLFFSAGITTTSTEESSIATTFEQASSRNIFSSVGQVPTEPSCATWTSLPISDASPLAYNLTSISQLLSPKYFGSEDHVSLLQKQSMLNTALIYYCTWMSSNDNDCYNLTCDSPTCDGIGYKFNGCPGLGIMMTTDYGSTWTCQDSSCSGNMNMNGTCSEEPGCVSVIPENDLYTYSCNTPCNGLNINNGTHWICQQLICLGFMVYNRTYNIWECQDNGDPSDFSDIETGIPGTVIYNSQGYDYLGVPCPGTLFNNQTQGSLVCQSNTCTGTMEIGSSNGIQTWTCVDNTCDPGTMIFNENEEWTCQDPSCPGTVVHTADGWTCEDSGCTSALEWNGSQWIC